MKTLTSTLALVLTSVVALSQPARAQGLFRQPGWIGLVPTGDSFESSGYFGQDSAGYLYVGSGGLGCFHPSAPDVAYGMGDINFFDLNGTRVGVYAYALLTPDQSAVDVAFFPRYPYWQKTGKESVRLFRVSCAALAAGGPSAATPLGGTLMVADSPLLAGVGTVPTFTRLASGALCFPTRDNEDPAAHDASGIICVDPATTPPTITQLVDTTTLDDALDVDPGLARAAYLNGAPPAYQGWAILSVVTAPGDRVFFIADRSYRTVPSSPGVFGVHTVRWLVERGADGTLTTRFGPITYTPHAWNALSGGLAYLADLNAVVAWPVEDQEYSPSDYAEGGLGWTGVGLRVFPLDAPGSGYLPLSQPFLARLGCEETPSFCNRLADTSAVAHDGGLQITQWDGGANPNSYRHEIFALEFDKDTLDLDDDGLSAAEEAVLGTWDTVSDSDGGGTPDGIEVHLSHTDPTDAAAEPAGQRDQHGTVRYVPSSLIRSRLPAASSDAIRIENLRTAGIDGPFCQAGSCYGPEGLVATWPVDREVGAYPVVAYDGTFIMIEAAEGLVRFYFEDGREELAVPRAALDAYVPTRPQGLRFVPVDGERTWVASDGSDFNGAHTPAIVGFAVGDAPIAIVYDHAQAQRDSGLNPGDAVSGLGDFQVASEISVIGWNGATEQLEIGVRGRWDNYLIGLGVDGAATLLSRGRARAGMNALDWRGRAPVLYEPYLPPYLLPTGHGDHFTTGGLVDPFGRYADGRITAYTSLERPPLGIWGDVLLESVCCGFEEDGVYELVRYDASVAPGDVLLMNAGGYGGMTLSKSGPRGGVAALWPEGPSEVVDATGMDVAPDGTLRLCVADAALDVVWEFEPAGPGGAPELVRYTADVPGLIDCAYDDAGTLSVLALGPARVETRDGEFGDLTVSQSLPSAPEPIAFVRGPDGQITVRLRGDGLRGLAYLPDGRMVSMRDDDFTVRVDGTPVVDLPRLLFINFLGNESPKTEARVAFAVRPDGLVVVVPHHAATIIFPYATRGTAYVVDPAGGASYVLGAVGGLGATALAVVPGGVNADPWTGRVRGPAVVVPPGVTPPAVPLAPSGGERLAVAEGCAGGAAGSGSGPASALVLALALALAHRSRRTRRG